MIFGEDLDTHSLLEQCSISNYRRLLDGVELLVIDEAHNIPNIGQKLKLMVDEIKGIKVIASGSSSFDLLNKAGEPFVGRSSQFYLHPFSQDELSQTEYLRNFVTAYLLKDILALERIKNAAKMKQLNKSFYFWRTYDGQEIDFIEEMPDNKLQAFEFKWNKHFSKIPKAFADDYLNVPYQTVYQDNYLDFVLDRK